MDRNDLLRLGLQEAAVQRAQRLVLNGQLREFSCAGEGDFRARVELVKGSAQVFVRENRAGAPALYGCSLCGTGPQPCEHAAALLLALSPARRDELLARSRSQLAQALLEHFGRSLPLSRDACLQLEVHLQTDENGPARVALRIGIGRMYVVRGLHNFLERYFAQKGVIRLGKSLEIDTQTQCFAPEAEKLLSLLLLFCRSRALALETEEVPGKVLPLEDGQLAQLLEALADQPFFLILSGVSRRVLGVHGEKLDAHLRFYLRGDVIELEAKLPGEIAPLTRDGRFVFARDCVYRLSDAQLSLLKPFFLRGDHLLCHFRREEGEELLSEMLPLSLAGGCVELDDSLRAQADGGQLAVRVDLDAADGQLLARLRFCYDAITIDPFRPGARAGSLLLRDLAAEKQVLDLLASYGFLVRPGEAHLSDAPSCYRFLSSGIDELQALAEVYAARALLRLKPRRQRPSGRLFRRGSRLYLELEMEEIQPQDYEEIFRSLREKKQYVRLRSGLFLTLDERDGWQDVYSLLQESDSVGPDGVSFSLARAGYLPELLQKTGLSLRAEDGVLDVHRRLLAPAAPACPIEGLRPYQTRGFAWLCALAELNLGGILADDMGLGKTVQVLALLLHRKQSGASLPSLVVAPTSLVYNWFYEIRRFAPALSTQVLLGQKGERRTQLADLEGVDVVLCSYAQLRRDMDLLSDIDWDVAVLDEAQQIKNAASVGAEAARRLRAQARFALTGTPMENHLGELWSLVDFCLPGYLRSQSAFLQSYGEGQNLETLYARLQPFLMRRVKADVLQELPDKLEQTFYCRLADEQRRLYEAELLRARDLVERARAAGTLSRQNFEVLSLLTRLRQICCHPLLCYDGYAGASGKLELLEQLLTSLLEGGHRVLVFSQFTSMLALIRQRLDALALPYLYLDGDTPAKERLSLVERFNARECPLFLISLRAGGFGLNLTAADSVIHYDPWWNPAVEDQATDRAHRIGQTKEVSVFKLISENSIEEKVLRLQEEKKTLIDAVVRPGEAVPQSLTASELLSLFG